MLELCTATMTAIAAIAFTFGLNVSTARAIVIASDNFESYTDGSTIIAGTGGSGWAQPWIGNTTTGTPVTLASSGKIAGQGKSLELGVASANENRGIAVRQFPGQMGDLYIGMTLQTTNGWDGDFWQIYVNDTYSTVDGTTPSFSAGLLNDPIANRYFARKGPANANGSTSTTTFAHTSVNDDVHTFVVKLSKSTGVATDLYDQISLWIDKATEVTPDGTLGTSDAGTASLNTATVSTIHFRVSSLEPTDRVYLDNLKVATTYAELFQASTPGDFNNDSHVDAGDYVTWKKGLLAGTLTQNDYDIWRQHFGSPAAAGTSGGAVPEPSTWVLLAICLNACIVRRKR